MLGRDYIEINGVGYTPSQFSYELQAIEDVSESEAGTELIDVTRLDKHVFHASWEGIDATLLGQLEEICKARTVSLTYKGDTYLCRARGINPQLINRAWKYRHSDGLWNVSVNFTQV